MTKPVPVLHVLGSLERGGVETWLLDLLPRLDRSEWQFDFCALGAQCGRYAPLARSWGSRVLSCPLRVSRGPEAPGGLWSFLFRMYRLLRAGGYRVVHSHVHCFSAFVLAAARAAKVPVRVAHSHNTHDGRLDTLARTLYRSSAVWLLRKAGTLGVACSAPAAGALFGGSWRQDARVTVVHYGIGQDGRNSACVDRVRLRRELGIAEGAAVVGHVGRLEPQKNHGFLLEIAAALKDRRPDVRWLLVGEGELRREVEKQVRRLGLEATVVLCGRREDARHLMAGAMDLFVLPSVHEGLPLVLLEAQAAGLRSVVSSRITREAVAVEGAVEFLPLEAGPNEWAARVGACLERGRISQARAAARIKEAGFTIDQSLRRLLEAYRSSLGSR